MKNLLILLGAILFAFSAIAQEAGEKKVLAGLTLGAGLNFNDPETTLIDPKVGGDFMAGMNLDWHFADNIGLSTGLEFEFNRFTNRFNDTAYFDYSDKEVLQRGKADDANFQTNTGEGRFLLKKRNYRNIYLTIPLMLRFDTDYLGYMRYFGKFGFRGSFLLSSRGYNTGVNYPNEGDVQTDAELDDMQIPGSMAFFKANLGLSAGAEWNITGSTVLVGELGYYYGMTEVHQQEAALASDENKNKNMSLYNGSYNDKDQREYFTPSLRQSQLLLKVSILF